MAAIPDISGVSAMPECLGASSHLTHSVYVKCLAWRFKETGHPGYRSLAELRFHVFIPSVFIE